MKKILVDIVPVLTGILLAILISNWQQSRSERAYIENSIQAIINENELNVQELDNSIRRQEAFVDTLRKYDTDNYSLHNIVRLAGGLSTPDLRSTTWKFLIQDSKHTLVDYDFINRLAEIEKYEILINRHNEKVLDMFYQPAFFNDPDLKKVCDLVLQDMMSIERGLKQTLEDFIVFAKQAGYEN